MPSDTQYVITTAIAAYAAVVSTTLSGLAIYRDRHRLQIRIEWITHPTPGITVKCVNTGRRPVVVELVQFASRGVWDSRRGSLSSPSMQTIGWRGEEYPDPPTPTTTLPIHLDLARDATLHFRLDDRFNSAAGVVVLDGFGKVHRHKFTRLDRIGLALVLQAQITHEVLDAAGLNALADRMSDDPELASTREQILALAARAENDGPFELAVAPDQGSSPGGFLYARRATGGAPMSVPLFSPEERTLRIQRPPFPLLGVLAPLLLATLLIGISVWLNIADAKVTITPAVVVLLLLPLALSSIVMVRRASRLRRRRIQPPRGNETSGGAESGNESSNTASGA